MKPQPHPLPPAPARGSVRPRFGAALISTIALLLSAPHLPGQIIINPTLDYGDAPAPYPTRLADDGARHPVSSRVLLGKLVDAEFDGLPSVLADGDDTATANRPDDEDGIVFSSSLFQPGDLVVVTATASVNGFLDAWVDWNRNGSWLDAGDKVFNSLPLTPGANTLRFTVPQSVTGGSSYARFRFSTKGGLLPTGAAGDGEVEDYLVTLQEPLDYGDAPKNYPVTLAQDGARHGTFKGLSLGTVVDLEADGQPSSLADGDDKNPAASNDEDGVKFLTSPLIAGQTAQVQVFASIPAGARGVLDAWVDFNQNGSWEDKGEQIFASTLLSAGANSLSFTVPSTALAGNTFARFRLSLKGGLRSTGFSPDGEVEDYPIAVQTLEFLDFGDAQENYPVLLSQDGARHRLQEGFNLGARVDLEANGQPSALADGDDQNPPNGISDEDGVKFISSLIAGQSAQVQVTLTSVTGARGFVDAWIDFNRNGNWNDAGEQILLSAPLSPGVNTLAFPVPKAVTAGDTFARFRLSLQGGLKPTGLATEGEVEDYRVAVQAQELLDFGDAPQSFPVTVAQDGARHRFREGFNLGQRIDLEPDGQPSTLADGDDQNPPGTNLASDEDGVKFTSPLVAGQSAQVQVTLTSATGARGFIDAWLDFNGNGTWDDPGEQIFTSLPISPGVNDLAFTVPDTANPGTSFARFRLSLQGGLKARGPASEGEVEDHLVRLEKQDLDFGDAPENYPVLLSQDGARHVILKGLNLGRSVDAEPNGQPTGAADGDDKNPTAADDEDGVTFATNPLIPGQSAQVEVIVSTLAGAAARLDAWVDWNRNGSWDDPGEQVFSSIAVISGANSLSFTVPSGIAAGNTYARFRLSLRGGLKPVGAAPDGEVEDYLVNVGQAASNLDFGDASQAYPVLLAADGARHRILKGFNLGRLIDGEPDGQPTSLAVGDDNNPSGAGDDEDGVRFLTAPLEPGEVEEVEVIASAAGRLDAWIDFYRNANWSDPNEQIFTSVALSPGSNILRFIVPRDAQVGNTFARFRFSREGGLKPTGEAPDGEVEDYQIAITPLSDCNDRTHRGTDFWLTFPGNYAPDPANPVKIGLCITGPGGTAGTVTIPGLGFTNSFIIPASQMVNIPLPQAAELAGANDLIEKKGIHITSKTEVSVYGLNRVKYTSDGYLGLPSDVIGRRYIIQGYANEFTGVPELNGTQFAIVAPSDNTTVFILPKVETGGHSALLPFSITLNQGETYQLRNTNDFDNDLSGTLIVADKAIAVFGSHQCANIPDNHTFYCDYIVEQLLPVERAGTYFVTMPLKTRNGDTFRFAATRNNTVVSVNGLPVANLNLGQIHERIINGPARITATQPIMVTQYSNSSDYDSVRDADPFMVNVTHPGQFLNNYLVCTPDSGFATNYLNVVAPNLVVGALTLNGVPVPAARFVPIPGTVYSGAQLTVPPGAHNLSANLPFGVMAYGFSEYDSYGYPGGMFFGDTRPPELTCPQDEITVTLGQGTTGATACVSVIPDLRGSVKATDNCGLPERVIITQTPAPGTVVGAGRHEIILSTPDVRGNVGYCIVAFIVIDPSPLQIFCPENMVVNCNGQGGAKVDYRVSARKLCEQDIQITCVPPPGSFFPVGTNSVLCTATDSAGKNVTCTFNIVVRPCGSAGPSISVSQNNSGTFTLSFGGGVSLQTAPTISGPWTTMLDAVSPFTVEIKNLQTRQGYYRLVGSQ